MLEGLGNVVDEGIGVDVSLLDDATLHDAVVGVQHQIDRLQALQSVLLEQWNARKIWAEDGSRSPGHCYARSTGLSINDAKRLVHRADALGAESKAQRLLDNRKAHVARTLDGVIDLQATLDPLNGEIFLNELQRIEDALFAQDWAEAKAVFGEDITINQLHRTPPQRRCDALVEMAKRSAHAPGGSNKPLLNILVGEDSFKSVCELASGVVITPGQVLPLLTQAQIESVVFDGKSKIIDITHRRSFTGAVRKALEIRDRHCQHESGCDVPAHKCQADHLMAWSRGGLTEQSNGQLLCAKHNRVKGVGPP